MIYKYKNIEYIPSVLISFSIYSELKGFQTEKELETYFRQVQKNQAPNLKEVKLKGAVVFNKGVSDSNLVNSPPQHTLTYKIRLLDRDKNKIRGNDSDDYVPGGSEGDEKTVELIPIKQKPGPNNGFKKYPKAPYLTIDMLDEI